MKLDLSTSEKIAQTLHDALANIEKSDRYVLLDYPDNRNIGDQLIWLGNVFYLSDILKAKIDYAATASDFCEIEMQKRSEKCPILLHGGGNFGDLWQRHQIFREKIILKYRDRPIIILPQTIYYSNLENLKKTAEVFNSHSNLTLFVRDNNSYNIASEYFTRCQVIKSPDTAFHLINLSGLLEKRKRKQSILYHARTDRELNKSFSDFSIDIANLVIEDWHGFRQRVLWQDWISYRYEASFKNLSLSERLKILKKIAQESKHKGLKPASDFLKFIGWQYFHPRAKQFNWHYNPYMHRRSWGFLQAGIEQLSNYKLVITNRLHGHILCVILKIPHVFLANSYYKNEAFYETWTYQLSFCKFVKEASQIESAVEELLKTFPRTA